MMTRGRAREDARGCERRAIGGNEMFASIGGVSAMARAREASARARGAMGKVIGFCGGAMSCWSRARSRADGGLRERSRRAIEGWGGGNE